MSTTAAFIFGLVIGVAFGVLVMSVMATSKQGDEQ